MYFLPAAFFSWDYSFLLLFAMLLVFAYFLRCASSFFFFSSLQPAGRPLHFSPVCCAYAPRVSFSFCCAVSSEPYRQLHCFSPSEESLIWVSSRFFRRHFHFHFFTLPPNRYRQIFIFRRIASTPISYFLQRLICFSLQPSAMRFIFHIACRDFYFILYFLYISVASIVYHRKSPRLL